MSQFRVSSLEKGKIRNLKLETIMEEQFVMSIRETIAVLDFGSQYTQLIARRIRESKVYCKILPYNAPMEELKAIKPKGLILSGGPSSVYDPDAPQASLKILEMGVPVFGICYGMQWMSHQLDGEVVQADRHEYGRAELEVLNDTDLFYGIKPNTTVWMSHGDHIIQLPEDFEVIAQTSNSPVAAMRNKQKKWYGVQFHPEVVHTPEGVTLLKNFLYRICECSPSWIMESFIKDSITQIKKQVGQDKVVCALSGGVDSSVAAVLVHRAIGDQLTCIFVNNGLLRKGEAERVINTFQDHFKINLRYAEAQDSFLSKLSGVVDPEEKRKIIGHEFIRTFEAEAKKIGQVKFLAQGTLYPDVIESVSVKGPSAVIKSHHNVGGLPEKMQLKLVEPLRELFKDEVRLLGKKLALPDEIIWQQPFPGPGLAVRIIDEVTSERLEILREADAIVTEEIKRANLYRQIWQSFAVLLPVKSVGVMGDERTYDNVIALRAVNSSDGMTADWVHLPYKLLNRIANRIINEVVGVNRVVYDITSKPPGTIEWE